MSLCRYNHAQAREYYFFKARFFHAPSFDTKIFTAMRKFDECGIFTEI